ncbi:hypothetical protein [Photobacterium nomapromontoriensis]|uniref:hypothetical protein n=1 Tax=Photobacterium nomapromontoriensis TaxID=2910237 RepID=UPI003D0D060A
MKTDLKITAIAAALLLVGCASDSNSTASLPTETNISETISQTESLAKSIQHSEEQLSQAQQDELVWFASSSMNDAEKALQEAKEYYTVFEKDPSKAHNSSGFFSSTTNLQAADEAIQQFEISLNKAKAIRTQSLSTLEEAFSYRKQLQYINAAKYYPSNSKGVESELKKLVGYIADGDIEQATKAQPTLVTKQRALEVKTITRIYLTPAKEELARLKQAHVSLHAPDTLAAAAATIPAAETFIAAEPRAIAKIQDKADEAMFALHHAGHIADGVTQLKALSEQDYERYVLKFESILLNISQALGADDLRDTAISEQGKTLVSYIRTQQLDSTDKQLSQQQLLAQLAAQDKQVALLKEKIAQLTTKQLTVKDETLPVTPVKANQNNTAAEKMTPVEAAPAIAPEPPAANPAEKTSDVKAVENNNDKITG